MSYTYSQYLQLIDIIKENYGLVPFQTQEEICDFSFENESVIRLVFNEEDQSIIITFHISLPISDTTTMFNQLHKAYKKLKLAEPYYIFGNGNVVYGKDAESALLDEIERVKDEEDGKTLFEGEGQLEGKLIEFELDNDLLNNVPDDEFEEITQEDFKKDEERQNKLKNMKIYKSSLITCDTKDPKAYKDFIALKKTDETTLN